jgi:Domain of unknown function (DUF397)
MTERFLPDAAALSGWRKSSYSSPNADSCVEVIDDHPSGIPVRDSKIPQGPALVFAASEWTSFISAIKRD